jgi:hypothetical protein
LNFDDLGEINFDNLDFSFLNEYTTLSAGDGSMSSLLFDSGVGGDTSTNFNFFSDHHVCTSSYGCADVSSAPSLPRLVTTCSYVGAVTHFKCAVSAASG